MDLLTISPLKFQSELSCIHHSLCGDVFIEAHFPDFFETHPHAEIGGHWEVCLKCTRAKYIAPTDRPSKYNSKEVKTSIKELREIVLEPGYVTVETAAELLGLKPNTIRIYIRDGKLRGRQIEIGSRKFWQVEILSIREVNGQNGG